MDVRAAPVRSWAIAVYVCVICMIYHGITVHHCTLVRVHTRARLASTTIAADLVIAGSGS